MTLDIEHSLPVLLTMLANRITATGTETFKKRHGLGSAEWKALSMVASLPGSSGAEIADLLGMDRGGMSRTMQALARKGLVVIEKGTKQGNIQTISMTSKGESVHASALVTAHERERLLIAGLDAERHEQLLDALHLLLSNMASIAALKGLPQGESG